MLKKLLPLAIALISVICLTNTASAVSYVIDFNSFHSPDTTFDLVISHDGEYDVPKMATFEIDLDGKIAQSGTLSIAHSGNSGFMDENWLVTDFHEIMGTFSKSDELVSSTNWVLDSWELSSSVLERITLYSILPVLFWETTDGFDWIKTYYMRLNITTKVEKVAPVPESSTMILLSVGLFMTAAFGRKTITANARR